MLKKLSVKLFVLIGMVTLCSFSLLSVFTVKAETYNGVTVQKNYDIATASEEQYANYFIDSNNYTTAYWKTNYSGDTINFHSGRLYEAEAKSANSTVRLFDEYSGVFSIVGQGFYDQIKNANNEFKPDYKRLAFQFTNLENPNQYLKFSFTQSVSNYLELNIYYYDKGINATSKISTYKMQYSRASFTGKVNYFNSKNIPFKFQYDMATGALNFSNESGVLDHDLTTTALFTDAGTANLKFTSYAVDMHFEDKSQEYTAKFLVYELCGQNLSGEMIRDTESPQILVDGKYRNAYLKGEILTVYPFTATDENGIKQSGYSLFNGENEVEVQGGEVCLQNEGVYKIVYYAVDNFDNRQEVAAEFTVTEITVAESIALEVSNEAQSIPQLSLPSGWYYRCQMYLQSDENKENALLIEDGKYLFNQTENYLLVYSVIPQSETEEKFVYQTAVSVTDTQKPVLLLDDEYNEQYTVQDALTIIGVQVIDNSGNAIWSVGVFYGAEALEIGADGRVVLEKLGRYEIVYTASDSAGNESVLSIFIEAVEKTAEQPPKNENGALAIALAIGGVAVVLGGIAFVFKRKKR